MLDGKFKRGFAPEALATMTDPRIRKDDKGYYMMSLSENTKVYFEDYYSFLERTYAKCQRERFALDKAIVLTPPERDETLAFYRAKGVIVDRVMSTIMSFYTDGGNFGVIMSPWCFGTVMLEKLEVYRERLGKGEVHDPNIADYPYYVLQYMDEIHKSVLLDLFDFPEKAFQMRWQYSELLKRYSSILNNISSSLQSVLMTIKTYGS